MKITSKQMNQMLKDAEDRLRAECGETPSRTFRHYKGGIYNVIGFALHTDNMDVLVRYRRIDGPGFDAKEEVNIEFCRPLRDFLSETASGERRFTPVYKVDHFKTEAEMRSHPPHKALTS